MNYIQLVLILPFTFIAQNINKLILSQLVFSRYFYSLRIFFLF